MVLPGQLTNAYKKALGMPEEALEVRRRAVLGWNYRLDIQRDNGEDVIIFKAHEHKVGDLVLDIRFTGKQGEVLSRVAVFKEIDKE